MAIVLNVAACEIVELVRPVRALPKQNKKIEAIKLVRERTGYGLKESKDFVDHVHLLPGERAIKVAELWTNASVGDTPDHKAEPAGTSNGMPGKRPAARTCRLLSGMPAIWRRTPIRSGSSWSRNAWRRRQRRRSCNGLPTCPRRTYRAVGLPRSESGAHSRMRRSSWHLAAGGTARSRPAACGNSTTCPT